MRIKEDRGIRLLSHTTLGLFSLACVLPFIFLLVSSISSETSILDNGYSFFPENVSLTAYVYLIARGQEIGHAYLISIFNTIVGTTSSLIITSLLAYALSKPQLPGRSLLNFYVIFTMLFNGGLVPAYLIYSTVFHIKDTIFALLIPNLLMNAFSIILVRSYFVNSIPQALIDSAKIDGAGEFATFRRIVIPMSFPILATVGLLAGLAYWNDWNNGLIYLTKTNLYSLQNLLNRILANVQYLKNNDIGQAGSDLTKGFPAESARMAMAAIGVIPILCAYPFFQKYFVKGIALGAVKE